MAGKGAKRVSGLMETARRLNARAVLVSGLAAGAAFVAVLEADLRLAGRNVDDLVVLGRPLVKNRDDARKAGAAVHAVNSVALAALYTAIEKRLPGPPWVRGVIFANVENMILYPLTALEDFHPAVQDGQIDSYFTWPAFWQSVPRHIAYGAVLGVLYDRLAAQQEESRRSA